MKTKLISNIEIPIYLRTHFQIKDFRVLNIDNIYVGLKNKKKNKIDYVYVKQTPHFQFVQNFLFGIPNKNTLGYIDYNDYISTNPDARSEKRFIELINSIKDNDYDFVNSPILVFRPTRFFYFFKRWYVADGFHRLAILTALGQEKIFVSTLKNKQTFIQKIIESIYDKK